MFEVNAILASENTAFKFVKVAFSDYPTNNSKLHTYKTTLEVEEGDSVIVNTPSEGFKVVKVHEVLDITEVEQNPGFSYKWVVDRINVKNYEKCVDAEKSMAKEIRAAMQAKRLKELQDQMAERIGAENMDKIAKISRL